MKKRIYTLGLLIIIASLIFTPGCSCGKKKGSQDAYAPTEGQSAADVAKNAENMSFKSGSAEDGGLYADQYVPLDSFNVFVQKHTEDEFPVYEGDEYFFFPSGPDYLKGEFESGKTLLYSFDSMGDPIDVKGRIVYKSRDELLNKNKEKELTEGEFNESGYTYYDNVLYYFMNEEDLFSIESITNKYDLLKNASAGKWDKYTYWFSMPYKSEGEYVYYVTAEPNVIISESESDGLRVDGFSGVTDSEVYNLFTNVMKGNSVSFNEYKKYFANDVPESYIKEYYNTKYRSPSEFEDYEVIKVIDDEDSAYSVVLFYTIKPGYPDVNPDSYMFAALINFDYEEKCFKIANPDNFRFYEYDYYENILTPQCYSALLDGMPYKRFWVPFALNRPVGFKNVLTAKVLDAFLFDDGTMAIEMYFYNDTDNDMTITTVDRIALNSERGLIVDGSANLDLYVPAHDYMIGTMYVPPEYVNYDWFTDLTVVEFSYSVDIY